MNASKPSNASVCRRQQILEVLVRELEQPNAHITTARLAQAVGVSEAALYRYFPSKAKMFDALFDFAEAVVFPRLRHISANPLPLARRTEQAVEMLLRFIERNPGITRVLIGEALFREAASLRQRAAHFFVRLEAELRAILRPAASDLDTLALRASVGPRARLLCAFIQGSMLQSSLSQQHTLPTAGFADIWPLLERATCG